jgi:hypothetical protein
VARAIIVLRNMITSLYNVRGRKRCRRRIVALWLAEQELNSPARMQNLGMSSDRRPMSGSYCRRDACAISDKIALFRSSLFHEKAIVHVGGEPFGSRFALQHDVALLELIGFPISEVLHHVLHLS